MYAAIAKIGQSTGSKLSSLFTRASSSFAHMKKGEVAEALIATWCIEFLRMRQMKSFNVIEMVTVSILMLGVKAVIADTGRRRHEGRNHTFVMSDELSPMDRMGNSKRSTSDSFRRSRGNPRHRRRVRRTPTT